MSKSRIALIVVIVIIAITAFFSLRYFNRLEPLIESAIEDYGSEILQVNVTVASVELDVSQGEARIHGLFVGNPPGYKTPHLLRLEQLTLNFDIDSLTSLAIKVSEVSFQQADIIYELAGFKSNLKVVQENIDHYNGAADTETEGGVKLIIEHLYINDGKVNFSHHFLAGKKLSVPLPDIHLRDIGREDKAATPAEVTKKTLGSLQSAVQIAVRSLKLNGEVGKTFTGVKEKASTAGETVNKGVEEASKKMKSLFK